MIDDEVGKKHYHYAIVTRIEDDTLGKKLRGAIFVKSDTLTEGVEWPDPIEPSFPLAGKNGEGFFWIPQIGDQVEIEIDSASEHPVPKYIRMLYSDEDDIAEEFKENYGHRMGWKTRAGHILLFDNKDGSLLVKLMHNIGTGFEWNKDGDEIKTVIGNLEETIKKKVIREIQGQMTELFKAEVKRTYDMKVLETFKNDLVEEIKGALKIDAKSVKINSKSTVDILAQAMLKVAGTSGTTVGAGAGITNVLGSLVNLAGGGVPVALLGSTCFGVGPFGIPVISTVIQGATKVTAN